MCEPQDIILTLDFKDKEAIINQMLVDSIGNPNFFQIYLHHENKLILFMPCAESDTEAISIYPTNCPQREFFVRTLIHDIRKITGWKDFKRRLMYGENVTVNNKVCALFKLDEAKIIEPTKNKKGA